MHEQDGYSLRRPWVGRIKQPLPGLQQRVNQHGAGPFPADQAAPLGDAEPAYFRRFRAVATGNVKAAQDDQQVEEQNPGNDHPNHSPGGQAQPQTDSTVADDFDGEQCQDESGHHVNVCAPWFKRLHGFEATIMGKALGVYFHTQAYGNRQNQANTP